MKKTLYDVLGITPDATAAQIEARCQQLLAQLAAQQGQPEADNQIKFIQHARETLGDPVRKALYDQRLVEPAPVASMVSRHELPDGPSDRRWLWVLLGVILLGGGYYLGSRWHAKSPQPTLVTQATVNLVGRPAQVQQAATLSSTELFERVSPSIVVVMGLNNNGDRVEQGSGVVIAAGQVITNCHVALGAPSLEIYHQGKQYDASLHYRDQGHDLCQLSVTSLPAQPVPLGALAAVKTGDPVYALGAPQGLELSLSQGIVSSLREFDTSRLIQTTASISPGSSGGGLFDRSGKLIGITTFQSRTGQNLNFAVPVDWIAQLPTRDGNSDQLLGGDETNHEGG
ncbi:trypsin-like peptidase domain-containing protein [Andreprevotia chitinilytica]|uniref:trypsin-like peptidase domain-containing protein n=1 Tax=Andreprevotia chitinilytica TaxID=396808 RepID=UPI00068DA05F|nr:trypsin-like peptidase domain-containing protein [Andreprevotia chitinilytica]